INGFHTWSKYSHFGGIISLTITKNWCHLSHITLNSNSVNRIEIIVAMKSITRIIGVRDFFSCTTFPLGSAILVGGKILSYIISLPLFYLCFICIRRLTLIDMMKNIFCYVFYLAIKYNSSFS